MVNRGSRERAYEAAAETLAFASDIGVVLQGSDRSPNMTKDTFGQFIFEEGEISLEN